MFLQNCRNHIFHGYGSGGGRGGCGGSLLFKSLVNYSANTMIVPSQNAELVNYLINSLGFTKETAISTSRKVIRLKPVKDEPQLVVSYLKNLGMSQTEVRKLVYSVPKILFYSVNKTLVPKTKVLEEVGLSRLDIERIIVAHKSLLVKGLNSFIRSRIEYYRKVFATNDIVIAALKKYALRKYKLEQVGENVLLLQNFGFTNDYIVKLIAKDPRNINFMFTSAKKFRDALRWVENDLGIPRESATFHHGICVITAYSQSNIEGKFKLFKSFGWSDANILGMVRNCPLILCASADKLRRALDCYMNEIGYSQEDLALHPILLSLSLEQRVKPRIEVLKVLSNMKLNKSKASLSTLLVKPEANFLKDHVLKYKNLLPEMCAEYFEKVERLKMNPFCV